MEPQSPVQNVTPAPTTHEAPKDNHGITIAAMAIFVLLSLAAVAFLYYQNQQLKNMLATYQTTPIPTPTATADATANWKTYTNAKMKFTIGFPQEFIAEEITDIGPNDQRVVFKGGSNTISSFSVSTSPSDLPQYPYDQKPTGSYSLDGNKGIYLQLPQGYADGLNSNPPPLLALYFKQASMLYQINFYGTSTLSDILVQDILSTFKFTEATPSATPSL